MLNSWLPFEDIIKQKNAHAWAKLIRAPQNSVLSWYINKEYWPKWIKNKCRGDSILDVLYSTTAEFETSDWDEVRNDRWDPIPAMQNINRIPMVNPDNMFFVKQQWRDEYRRNFDNPGDEPMEYKDNYVGTINDRYGSNTLDDTYCNEEWWHDVDLEEIKNNKNNNILIFTDGSVVGRDGGAGYAVYNLSLIHI